MSIPLLLDRAATTTLERQIAVQIAELMRGGRLRPGTRLPSTRVLAETAAVSRNTVLRAYEVLVAEGYADTRAGSGTYLATHLPEACLQAPRAIPAPSDAVPTAMPPLLFQGPAQDLVTRNLRGSAGIDFFPGRPGARAFPLKLWRRLVIRQLGHAAAGLAEYNDPAGLPALRAAIAGMLGPARGISADPGQIVVTAGIQEGINIAARLFVDRNTATAAESPCYQGAAFVLRSTAREMIPVAVDAEGIDPDALPDRRVAVLYVTPSHQYPTGATLTQERRHALIAWARRNGCYILEDDYDSDFRYDGPPLRALAALAPDCVIYLGTFSKSLGAGLRVGYMVLPHPIARAAGTAKTLLNNGNAWLEQAVLAEMIQSGSYSNHLLRIRRLYMESRDLLVASLQQHFAPAVVDGVNGGLHVLWRLPETWPEAVELEAIARRARVGIYSLARGGVFDRPDSALSRHALILGYAAVAPARIGEGIARLAAALGRSVPSAGRADRPGAMAQTA